MRPPLDQAGPGEYSARLIPEAPMSEDDIPFKQRLALDLLQKGWRNIDVARDVGVSWDLVAKWRAAAGVQLPEGTGYRKRPKRLRGEELLRLGWRNVDVAGEVGVSPSS